MNGRLSAKSANILQMIASGKSYCQIVEGSGAITYLDIFEAAREALTIDKNAEHIESGLRAQKRELDKALLAAACNDETPKRSLTAVPPWLRRIRFKESPSRSAKPPKATAAVVKARLTHPRAYERWTPEEDAAVRRMHLAHVSRLEIACRLQRQPQAVFARMVQLRLLGPTSHKNRD
ncbi:MAG TPA: hypothetical protein VNC50_21245 [Planctomycetia bacterium]|nr:hypothetical protein [Planctomycetia bacterium]